MQIRIPGGEIIEINNAVFDYNGTIAQSGYLSSVVREKLIKLAQIMPVYVLTADTNGSAREQCADLPVSLMILTGDKETTKIQKAAIVSQIGAANCVCFGNGFNDIEMLKIAGLSVAVMGEEGLCSKLVIHSDILVKSIEEGIELLFNPNKIIATLRN